MCTRNLGLAKQCITSQQIWISYCRPITFPALARWESWSKAPCNRHNMHGCHKDLNSWPYTDFIASTVSWAHEKEHKYLRDHKWLAAEPREPGLYCAKCENWFGMAIYIMFFNELSTPKSSGPGRLISGAHRLLFKSLFRICSLDHNN